MEDGEIVENLKLVLFDFDGTLADTMGEYARIASDIIERATGMPHELAVRAYYETAGVPFREQIAELAPGLKPLHHDMIVEYEDKKNEYAETAMPFPDVKQALTELRERGIKIGIVSSNSGAFVIRCLNRWGWLSWFDWVSGLGAYKDKHQQIKVALQQLGYFTNEVLYVGDSPHDALVADSLRIEYYDVSPEDYKFRRGISHILGVTNAS